MAATSSSVAASRALLNPGLSARHGPAKPDRLSFTPTGLRLYQKLHNRRANSARAGPIRAAAVEAVEPAATSESVIDMSVNAIRFLAIDAVEKANSGHPGLPMGCAPTGHILFDEIMRYNPKNPYWFNRDYFVLSAGHGCMLHYALLHLTGYDSIKEEDLKAFRQWGSRTPGHPENFETPGIKVKTGCGPDNARFGNS